MGLLVNGKTPTEILYHGKAIKEVMYKGKRIWPDFYPAGTKFTVSANSSNCCDFSSQISKARLSKNSRFTVGIYADFYEFNYLSPHSDDTISADELFSKNQVQHACYDIDAYGEKSFYNITLQNGKISMTYKLYKIVLTLQ